MSRQKPSIGGSGQSRAMQLAQSSQYWPGRQSESAWQLRAGTGRFSHTPRGWGQEASGGQTGSGREQISSCAQSASRVQPPGLHAHTGQPVAASSWKPFSQYSSQATAGQLAGSQPAKTGVTGWPQPGRVASEHGHTGSPAS
jgi:hypothetical protein